MSVPDLSGERFGPDSRSIVVEDNKARLEGATEHPVDVHLICSTDTFLLLMYGRLTLTKASDTGRLDIQGEPTPATDFDRWVKGTLYSTPR